ncbi:MAG: calcium/sodium antiporter [Oscillospiraceae bacterium]
MEIVKYITLLLSGFVLLIKGADFFVEGAASLARKLKIPPLVVGLTIVAAGTSAPELAVSVSSALNGANSMAVSNVLGSNIFNLLVVIGICSLITPVGITKNILRRDFPVAIGATLVFIAMLLVGTPGNTLSRTEAVILLAMLAGYMTWTVVCALKERRSEQPPEEAKPFVWYKCLLLIVGGAAGIVFGGDLVVKNASGIGGVLGMSETLIGLTICALGTSLPELVTSIAASRRGENDMAMGNVIGSNIFNIICILGVSGVISPITLQASAVTNTLIDCAVCAGVMALAYIFCLTSKKVTRAEGAVLSLMYAAYMAYAILRDTALTA